VNTINIGRKDVLWNYAATFLQIGVGVILLPFILRVFPQETIAIWSIFSTIIALTGLLDFGFNPSFARNVSYVVSGVKELKTTGYQTIENRNNEIDYSLFKGLIVAMRWFYARMATILFIILITAGTYYIYTILKSYSGSHLEIYIAWGILCIINTYSLYTFYYDALMQGKGLIKRSKQIIIVGQTVYLIVAIVMIVLHFNLIAIVSAQASSLLIKRILAHRTIYTAKFKRLLQGVKAQSSKKILKPIYPNAVKVGLTGIGAFLLSRSSIMLGSLFLPLGEIASYGITMQIINIIAGVAGVYFTTYIPKITQYRVQNDKTAIKHCCVKGSLLLFSIFIVGGLVLLFWGDWALNLIESKTPLLSKSFIMVALFVSLLETNYANAGGILLTKNEVPFFKAAILSGMCIAIGLFLVLKYTAWGVMGLVIIPLIVDVSYSSWKWPLEVIRDLRLNK
jgi:O-antigen/teichoic acid export membrane protein